MRPVVSIVAIFATGVALAIFVLVDKPGSETQRVDSESGQEPGDLTITVRDPGVREATAFCGRANAGTGYLSSNGAIAAACLTAVTSWPAIRYLENGEVPKGEWCRNPSADSVIPTAGATAVITGRWMGEEIQRRLVVNSKCEQALWSYLSPLLVKSTKPVIYREQDLKRD